MLVYHQIDDLKIIVLFPLDLLIRQHLKTTKHKTQKKKKEERKKEEKEQKKRTKVFIIIFILCILVRNLRKKDKHLVTNISLPTSNSKKNEE